MRRVAPPLLLMAVIFVLSAQPSTGPDLAPWEVALRKAGHMVGFGLLWFMWWRAFGYRRGALAVAITVLYAVSDELHQTFVPGRNGTPVDVGVDAAGMAIAGLLAARWRSRGSRAPARVGA